MALASGTRLGPYEILAPLGEGGMGEVYRARDTRVDRPVALKVLPEEFFESEERRGRFEREARMLASLNHPGIAVLYSFEEIPSSSSSSSRHLLVMELVEGDDLAQRILSGPLPLEESLSYARQIAEALEAAHEKGIVHRDLKPANVKITPDGRAKVLDFGLAKIFDADGGSGSAPSVTHSPTLTARATAAGVILGTAAYMSPEQARGKPVDKRTDVWAFGCVLFEMLTGKRAFEGETVTDVLAAILTKEPAWSDLPEKTPEKIRDLLRKCLRREAKQRLHDIADARLELEEAEALPRSSTGGRSDRAKFLFLPWALAAAFAAAAGALALRARAPVAPDLGVVNAVLPLPDGAIPGVAVPAVSPDGRAVAFSRVGPVEHSLLWVRTLASEEARAVPGTDGAHSAFWSPDSRSIAFFARGKLKRIDLAGGVSSTICDAVTGRGGSWGQDGTILFSGDQIGPILRVSASGGVPTPATKLDTARGHTLHRWPQILPDGRHFLYWASAGTTKASNDTVYFASLDGKTSRAVLEGTEGALFSSGQILFTRKHTLFAQPFDAEHGELSGQPLPLAENVAIGLDVLHPGFSAGRSGVVAYLATPPVQMASVEWFDRGGRRLGPLVPPDTFREVSISPDGSRVAIEATDPSSRRTEVRVITVADGSVVRLTSSGQWAFAPVWSPDGRKIAFVVAEEGRWAIYSSAASGGDATLLLDTDLEATPTSWSPDGRSIALQVWDIRKSTKYDIWLLPAAGGKPEPFLATPTDEGGAAFSPDGRWIAYQSDETGRDEVYVRPFPGPGGPTRVSASGGSSPFWRRDLRELLFEGSDRQIMSVEIQTSPTLRVGAPQVLFQFPVGTVGFAPAPDGKRFLIATTVGDRRRPVTRLLLGWARAGR